MAVIVKVLKKLREKKPSKSRWYSDPYAQRFLSKKEGNRVCPLIDECQKFDAGFASWNLCFGQESEQCVCESYIWLHKRKFGTYPLQSLGESE